jgi:quinol-cytochrome oxidoreductase complex cytochrome b subunit
MPKHSMFSGKVEKKEGVSPHPVWRGIGCILIVLIPALSYLGATILIDNRNAIPWIVIPPEIVLSKYSDPLIFVKILYTALITLIVFLIIAIITFIIDKFLGPPKYGPFDVKP